MEEVKEAQAVEAPAVEALEVPVKTLAEVAAENVGIQNTLEVVKFGVAVAKAIDEAKKNDGKIDLKDLCLLFPIAPLVVPMINDIALVPKELGDLSEVELQALLAEASALLGESGDKTAVKVLAALKFAHAGYDLYKAFAA